MSPEFFVPEFDIRVNGSPLHSEIANDVAAIEVVQEPNTLDHVRIALAHVGDPEFAIAMGGRTQNPLTVFTEGSAVQLSLGFLGDPLAKVFEGDVTGVTAIFPEEGPSTLEVHCHSYMHRLRRSVRTKTYLRQKDSAIAMQLGRQAGLTVRADDSKVMQEFVMQYNQTDLEFLLERASRIGFELLIEGKTLHFRHAGDAGSSVLKLKYGDSDGLLSATLREELLGQGDSVTVRSVDRSGKSIVGKALADSITPGAVRSGPKLSKRAFGATETVVVDRPLATKADADTLALSILNGRARAFVTGSGRAIGRPALRAGGVIELTGVGKTFDGKYYVVQSTHLYGEDGYHTSFRVRRNAVG